jgi:DNA-binding response OmpR family regulator
MKTKSRKFEVVPLAEVLPLIHDETDTKQAGLPRRRKILSVSSDVSLARTRFLLFTGAGFHVSSALGIEDAVKQYKTADFDMVVIGHSMPSKEKKLLLEQIQRRSSTSVLVLQRRGESKVEGADHVLDASQGPVALLETVASILSSKPLHVGM